MTSVGAADPVTARQRAFAFALLASIVLHLPLVPSGLVQLFDWLDRASTPIELVERDGEVIVPIDLDLDPHGETAPPEPAAAPPVAPPLEPVAVEAPKAPPRPPEPPPVVDAGAPKDADAGRAATPPAASAAPDAGPPSAPSLKEPLAQVGGPGRLAGKDAHVQVLIASDRIRKHQLGAAFGRLLTTIPEWKSFFDGTGIDPIRDFDHLLIAGPALRDSSKAVAILDYNLTEERIRKAIDVIVERSDPKGEWLEGTPVPTARGTADEGERLFALVPAKRLLAVLPASAADQLDRVKATKGFNRSSAAGIVIALATPGRAFRGLPVDVPDEIRWLRVSVVPRTDGGADVSLELLDESEALASKHAEDLEKQLEKLRKPDLGMFSSLARIELFQPVDFEASGKIIRAKGRVDEHQLRRIMTYAEELLRRRAERRSESGKKGGDGDDPYD